MIIFIKELCYSELVADPISYQMLLKDTDETHTLATPEILRRMKEEHGITMHRTTLPRDIEVLRAAGVDVLVQHRQAIYADVEIDHDVFSSMYQFAGFRVLMYRKVSEYLKQ